MPKALGPHEALQERRRRKALKKFRDALKPKPKKAVPKKKK